MSGTADAGDVVETTVNGVTVRKSYEPEDFPVPVIRILLENDRPGRVSLRLYQDVPEEYSMDAIGFHPDYYSNRWTAYEDNHLEFAGPIEAGETVETVFGVQLDDESDAGLFLDEPDVDVAGGRDPTEAEPNIVTEPLLEDDVLAEVAGPDSSDAVKDLISGEGTVPGLDDPAGTGADAGAEPMPAPDEATDESSEHAAGGGDEDTTTTEYREQTDDPTEPGSKPDSGPGPTPAESSDSEYLDELDLGLDGIGSDDAADQPDTMTDPDGEAATGRSAEASESEAPPLGAGDAVDEPSATSRTEDETGASEAEGAAAADEPEISLDIEAAKERVVETVGAEEESESTADAEALDEEATADTEALDEEATADAEALDEEATADAEALDEASIDADAEIEELRDEADSLRSTIETLGSDLETATARLDDLEERLATLPEDSE